MGTFASIAGIFGIAAIFGIAGPAAMAATAAPAVAAAPPWTDAGAWVEVGLPAQKVPATRFDRRMEEGTPVLHLETDGGYGVLVHRLAAGAPPSTLRWRWRLDEAVEGADLRRKAGDDAALKVCVMFELPLDRVPFVERQLLRLARMVSAQPLPAATLCYVWAPLLPAASVLPNAYTRRMRWMVLQGQGAPLREWRSERRSLREDFLRAFGDEADAMPPLAAIAVGADADNTGGRGAGRIAALEWLP